MTIKKNWRAAEAAAPWSVLYVLLLLVTLLPLQGGAQTRNELQDFPLHIQYQQTNRPVVVFLTGDGGWNSFSENLMKELGSQGYATIALDTRKYFWNQKTPEQFAADIKKILSAYLKAWNKDNFVISGYSFGADVGAFLPARLGGFPGKLKSLVLLSPGLSTGYVVKLKNMLNFGPSDREKYKIIPEIGKADVPVACIFGADEDKEVYQAIRETDKVHKFQLPGSHRYNDDVVKVVRTMMKVM